MGRCLRLAIKRKYLGEMLIDEGMITRDQLDECLVVQKKTGDRLGRILKNKGYVTERQLMEIMEFQLGIPFINLDAVNLTHMLSKHIPVTLARKHKMVPVKAEGKKLFVAMDDPVDFIALEDARVVSGLDIYPMLSTEHAIETEPLQRSMATSMPKRPSRNWPPKTRRKRRRKRKRPFRISPTRPSSAW